MKIGTSNIHNAIKFTVSIAYDAYVDIFLWVTSFSSWPLRFCQQKHSSSYTLFTAISNFEVEKSLWQPYLSPLYKI